MSTKQRKVGGRRPRRKTENAVPAHRVQELLLELAYRLHATKPVASFPRPNGSVA